MFYYPYPGWPYAAKAIVQYDFQAPDQFVIYLTFPLAMNTNLLPSASLFVVKDDGGPVEASLIEWIDAFTLQLISNTESGEGRVFVRYDGPSQNLKTTSGKQWEPWGYILGLNVTP